MLYYGVLVGDCVVKTENRPFVFVGKTCPLKKLINIFAVKDLERHEFFYVYCKKSSDKKIDAYSIGKQIAKLVLQ